jgi:hypothetical protein
MISTPSLAARRGAADRSGQRVGTGGTAVCQESLGLT